MSIATHTQVPRYAVAVSAVVLTSLAQLGLDRLIGGNTPSLLMLTAVLVSAWFGGLGPGLLATGLGALVCGYLSVTPDSSFLTLSRARTLVPLGIFTAEGLLISLMMASSEIAERRLQVILDHAPAVVYVKDERGRYTLINRRFETLYHVSRDQAVGKTDRELFPEATAEAFRATDRPVLEAGGTWEREEVVPHDDGPRVFVALKFPVPDGAGRSTRICGIATDITQHKRTEADLSRLLAREQAARAEAEASEREARRHQVASRMSEERFQAFMDALPAVAFTKDERGRYLYGNRTWRLQFEGGFPEPLGRSDFELWPEETARKFRESDHAAMAANRTIEVVEESLGSGGQKTRWMTLKFPLKEPEGRPIVGGIAIDITEQKRAELELRQAKEVAEAASRAKDRFLAMLSHELRTPLTPVLATVTAMLDDPEPPTDVRATLEMIRRSVELEARLIDDLLDVTRVVHGKFHLNRVVVDLHALLHQTLGICRSDLHGKRMRLELFLTAARHHVEADPARLQQVLWNLIKNAVKFSPEGGALAIQTRNEGPVGTGQQLVVEVADTGMGIAPEVLPRIFDAFEQGEDAAIRPLGGLGLGLAISRSIVEGHGGHLTAASAGRGQGATFRLELMAVDAVRDQDRGPASSPEAAPGRRSLKILLVEDDPPSLHVMARLLQQRGHVVTTASTLAAAVRIGLEEEFSLIISDIGLPDGNGLDLIRQLQARGPVRAVALSGYGMDEDLRRSAEAGFITHLTKPVNFPMLEATIQQVAAGLADTPGSP